MSEHEQLIRNISDTALWVAAYRAMESERPDAVFRDPFARKLAGPRGAAIANRMSRRAGTWMMTVRTAVIDELIEQAVQQDGFDTVLNLAAGLDTRPYRLDLPPTLKWIEVDLPDLIDYKEALLRDEQARCQLTRIKLDLADEARRAELFARIDRESQRVLVLTEGLLVYLEPEQVATLARDLFQPPHFERWIIDLMRSQFLLWRKGSWYRELQAGHAEFKFAPEAGTAFFRPYGWQETEFHDLFATGPRFKRDMPFGWLWRLLLRMAPPERRKPFQRVAGIVRFDRALPSS